MKKMTPRKIINGLKRKISIKLNLHPASHPYISGDTFRSIANYVHEIGSTFAPAKVQKNEIIFVQSHLLPDFFDKILPLIANPFILLSHNADENINSTYLPYLENPLLIHWFAQNCQITHTKLTPLPIGLENKRLYLHGIPHYFDVLRKKSVLKESKVLYKFSVSTNPTERGEALETLAKHPLAKTYTDWRESYRYLSTLQKNKFVASPPGNGEDCHRTWEAMYLGTVPILKKSVMAEHFASLGLPMIVVENWSELNKWEYKTLDELYATITTQIKHPSLFAEFWLNLITSKKIRSDLV